MSDSIVLAARNLYRRLQNRPPVVRTEGRPHQASRFRVLGLSMVRNEQDIIEPFVRHNMRFLDSLVVVDHASSDRTKDILSSLAREYPGLVCLDEARVAFDQSTCLTTLLQTIQAETPADFAVFLDADEFLTARSREAFEAALDVIPRGGAGLMPWRTYVLTPDTIDDAPIDPPRTMAWRRAVEGHSICKSILRLDRTLRPDIRVSNGAHTVSVANGVKVPEVVLVDLPLAHFPVRSAAQLTAKTVIGWAAVLAYRPRAFLTPLAQQWRTNAEAVARGERLEGVRLAEKSFLYATRARSIDWQRDVVRDPVPFDYRRTHSNGAFADPAALIASARERLRVPSETGDD